MAEADDARAHWLAHTAETRAAADRARAELWSRRTIDEQDEPLVIAEEWLAAHNADAVVEDQHRQVTDEIELADVVAQREADRNAAERESELAAGETDVADVRDVAAAEPTPVEDDRVRVPSVDETVDAIARAQRALSEIQQRQVEELRHAEEEVRAEELARWHADDVAAELEAPAMDRAAHGV